MADLTRFDFYAMRFIYSEDVMAMNAEEVGQYLLLMCHAWLGGKGASLPDDCALLEVYARGAVSAKVLAKFPIVETEHGARRRNTTLFREWEKVLQRYNEAAGRKGGQAKTEAKAGAARENGKLGGRPKNPSETQQNPSNNPSPKPNQAIPDQTEPSQTEPESETMSMKNRINEIAGKKVVNSQNGADLEFIARKYGKEVVLGDFSDFLHYNPDVTFPVSAYLKIADERLQLGAQSAIIQSDSRINEIVAFVYTVSQQAPRSADVAKLLAENSQEDIQDAFKDYADNLDEFGLKGSARVFFKDGAGTGIILARRQKKAADAALEASTKASIETGVEARRAEADARKKKIDDEEKLAEKLGYNPF